MLKISFSMLKIKDLHVRKFLDNEIVNIHGSYNHSNAACTTTKIFLRNKRID